jgi:hypothetical protein
VSTEYRPAPVPSRGADDASPIEDEASPSRGRGDWRGAIREEARQQLLEHRTFASELLAAFSHAARQMSSRLRTDGHLNVADRLDRGTDRVDAGADALAQIEPEDIGHALRSFARTRPALFAAAAFGLGFAVTRILSGQLIRGSERHAGRR